jgi:hypothetical protein
MSAQAPLKERIEDESAKGSGNEESANGSASHEESAKGAANDESAKGASKEESANGSSSEESTKGSGVNKGTKDPDSQESSSFAIEDERSRTGFYRYENPETKWDDEDEDEHTLSGPPNTTTIDGNASSSVDMHAEKSNNGSHAGKDEMNPNSAESQVQKEVECSDATPETAEKFNVFLKDKLQERQHELALGSQFP